MRKQLTSLSKQLTTGALTLLLAGASAYAAPVSPQQAMEIAREFDSQAVKSRVMRAPAKPVSLSQDYRHKNVASGIDAVYVFNRGEADGYILVSGDDKAPQILGYTDKGHFDSTNIPDNMRVMLDNWSNQIAWLSTHNDARALAPTKVVQAVEPLLGEITWDQGDPYNRKCPNVTQDDGMGGNGGKAPAATGCVATALGQIMYYHKWPLEGHGSISYTSQGETPEGRSENINVSVTFEGTQYNWDAMLPSLTSKSPSDAIDAVSTLLFHVGASFESIYGASTGATDLSVAPALLKYFDYDKGINYLKRDFFTNSEWDEILQGELRAGRPVAYGGVTRRKEGHFFVLDGVNPDGYYHVNWGWSGMEDGYYMLSLLEPGTQGTGGADGGAFHYAQNMIVGIQKPVEGSQLNYGFTCEGMTAVDKTVGRQETVTLTAKEIWNDSPNEVTANLGFALFDAEGKSVYSQMVTKQQLYGVNFGEEKISCSFLIPDNIPAGEYTLRPVYQVSLDDYSTDRAMMIMTGQVSVLAVTITENNITYASQGTYKLSLLSVRGDNEGDLENGVTKKVTLTVHNDGGEFHGPVQLRMFINGYERTFGRFDFPSNNKQAVWVSIPANSDSELTFDVGKFDLPGHDDYVVRLWGNEGTFEFDEDGYSSTRSAKNLCSIKGVKVVGPALPPVVELVDDIIVTTAVNGVVPRNDVGIKVCISNEGGEWTGKMRCAVWDPDVFTRNPLGYVEFSNTVTIDGFTDEQWINLTGGEMPIDCEVGKNYELTVYELEKNQAMVPSYHVTVEITMGEAVEKVAVLTLDDVTSEPETIMAGVPTDVLFHVSNTGYAYNGEMYFTVSRGGETLHSSSRRVANIERDDDGVIEFTETFELPTASDYTLTLFDASNAEIGKKDNVSFLADDPNLSLIEGTEVPNVIKCEEPTEYVFCVKNSGFRFDSTLRFVILLDGEEKFASHPAETVLYRGQESKVTFIETINIENGDNYTVRLLADDMVVGEFEGIKIEGYNSSVAGIVGDEIEIAVDGNEIRLLGAVAARMEVYTTDGRLAVAANNADTLDISLLGSGSYILRVNTSDIVKTLKFVKF